MFDYIQNIRAQHTVPCTADILDVVIHSTIVNDICAELADCREQMMRGEMSRDDFATKKAELKRRLPAFCFHAHFKNGRRLNAEAIPSGLSILETSANPFVMSMGPEHNATRRLNFAQAFNPIGSNLGVLIAATLILPHISPATAEQRASMSEAELLSTRSSELQAVMGPFVALSLFYIALAVSIAFVKVTETPVVSAGQTASSGGRLKRLLGNKRYSFGVVAQYFNIAAQTCIWTFTLHYVTDALGVSDKVAGYWLQASLLVFLVFRFLMVGLMGRFDARKLMIMMCLFGVGLSLFAMVSVNIAGAVAVALMSASISLLFPTIYGEALKGLGEDTKFGAAGLVMSIIGGATMPLVQGWVMDRTSAAFSYVTVGVCLSIVAAYGFYTLRADREDTVTVAASGT